MSCLKGQAAFRARLQALRPSSIAAESLRASRQS
jgi:hypothetical protein